MQQSISMLEFRKSPGEILNQVFYNKKKIILDRGNKKMAVLVPVGLFEKLFNSEDIEIYSQVRIQKFDIEDRLSTSQSAKVEKLLSSA